MTSDILLRDYNSDDEVVISKITEPLYYEKFKEFAKQTIQLAVVDGVTVGWLHLTVPESSLYSGFVFIYVAPKYRRKGISTWIYRQAESRLAPVGCNWWSSYPESAVADRFVLSVGFDYTNTNSYMVHDEKMYEAETDGIRMCRLDDYPTAPDIWSREYADMHTRIGIPYEKHELTDDERKEEYKQFARDINNGFVIELGRKIVGYGTLFSDNSGIGSVAVDRTYAGHGYGTRLSAFLTNECIRRGNKSPCLYCESGNDDAMHVYRKIGYVEVSRETVALKN